MKLFDNTNDLTEKEWEEVFRYPKKFKNGDIVEYVDLVWAVISFDGEYKCFDVMESVYKLENVETKKIAFASSTYLNHIGTFIDG